MERIRQWLNDGGTYQDGVDLLLQFSQDPDMVELFTLEMETDFKKKLLRQELLQVLKSQSEDPEPPNAGQATVLADQNELPAAAGLAAPVASEIVTELSQQLEQTMDELTEAKDQIDDLELQNEQLQDENHDLQKKVTTKSPGRWSHPSKMDQVEKELHDAWHPLFLEKCHLQNIIYDLANEGKTNREKCIQAGQMAHRILDLSKQCRSFYKKRDTYFTTGQAPMVDAAAEQYAVDPVVALKKLANAERYVRQMKNNLEKNPDDENSKRLLAKWQAAVDHYKEFLKLN
jgi:regulator of replication initiation timing